MLKQFLNASGGEANLGKCKIYGANFPPSLMICIYHVLVFFGRKNLTSFKYMGIPIALKHTNNEEWNGILLKIKDKMQSWEFKWLNPIGKVVLIKSILISLPLISMFMNSCT